MQQQQNDDKKRSRRSECDEEVASGDETRKFSQSGIFYVMADDIVARKTFSGPSHIAQYIYILHIPKILIFLYIYIHVICIYI